MSDPTILSKALAVLRERANANDTEPVWPADSWQALRAAGVPGWMIPPAYGGAGWDRLAQLEGYGDLAGACLTTCFLLSQRDAACRRLLASDNEALRAELLPPLARGDRFITVGVAQLTTSRQHVRPALRVREEADGFRLDGVMPWVTGAARADHFLTGAVFADGRQLVLVVPADVEGVHVGPPQPVMALQGALTAEVRCDRVVLGREWVVAGPAEKGLAVGRGPGGLETSGLALGLAGAALAYLTAEGEKRPEWRTVAEECRVSREAIRDRVRGLARGESDPEQAARIRAQANALVLRVTQLALAAAKGSGFVRSHEAQRWARQALFFLVWSCPRPALDATIDYLRPPAVD